ncbi:MAG: aldo/keto reductase family oxidoreductase [Bacilli bacterium]
MKYKNIPNTYLYASQMILGQMRISKLNITELEMLIETALKGGINFFDHADIYGKGQSERLFGEVLKKHPDWRKQMIIQSKCGIRQGFYDSSKGYIISSVEGILSRLGIDYLDVLLLHRPDALIDPLEVKEAFDYLEANHKVQYFGVSNMNSMQIELLQKHLTQKLVFNQLQFSLVHASMIDQGINVNMQKQEAIDRDGSIFDYSRLKEITIQAWSPLQASWEQGSFLNHPDYAKLNQVLDELSAAKKTSKSAIAISWIMRHPAFIQPILGTASIQHLQEMMAASEIELTKKEWYDLYLSVNRLLP